MSETTKPVTRADLKNQISTSGVRPFLYCTICQARYSADAGDYFLHPDNHVFNCCGEPMILATARTVIERVSA